MTWIRRITEPAHVCQPPIREQVCQFPAVPSSTGTEPLTLKTERPDGRKGDLWRCDACRALWRIGDACDTCDRYGGHPPRGHCSPGVKWRLATLWQRLSHWRNR